MLLASYQEEKDLIKEKIKENPNWKPPVEEEKKAAEPQPEKRHLNEKKA